MLKINCLAYKKTFFSLFFAIICISCFSQNGNSRSEFWNNVHYGGGIGIGFGNDTFNGAIAPSAIYQANDQVGLGLGLNLNYSKFGDSKLLAYGASLMSLYNPIQPLQLSVELEQLRINRNYEYDGGNVEDDYWSPALFIGIGYTNRNVTFGIRYDLLYDENKSIYIDPLMPFIRVYF